MSAATIMSVWGDDLTEADYASLAARWITREGANDAGIRRVNSITGAEMFNRRKRNMAGLIIPNILPESGHVREYRERLDCPELETRIDGSLREINKYVQPAERKNLLYFPPGLPGHLLTNEAVSVILCEGEFKCLAMWRLAQHQSDTPRFMPVAVAGVWNWRGTIGKTTGSNGDRRDTKGVIPDFDRIAWKGRKVVIAFDSDAVSNSKVMAARSQLTAVLIERGATVGFLEWPLEEGKGIDDRLAAQGPDVVLEDLKAIDFAGWNSRLLRNTEGRLLPCYDNVCLFLENSPEWAGVLGYNEFTGGCSVLQSPPSPVSARVGAEIEDHFDTEVIRWFERKRLMVKPELVRRVVDVVARRNSYHPVRDYLDALPEWDGTARIKTWLTDYCGVESSEYSEAIGEKFLISAIARIYQPGAKVDHILILESPQGMGKAKLIRTLASDEWFTDQVSDFGGKDASMQLRGVWLVELSELDALNRSDMARAKGFLTQMMDKFRPPFGRRNVNIPRGCVFIGTTNQESWLKDETGGRRFWPVRCRRIDVAGVARDRDQIWSEALRAYRAGVHWWLEDQTVINQATEEQRGRYIEDVWQDVVVEHAEAISFSRDGASIREILNAMGIDTVKQDQVAANRVQRCLTVAGWKKFHKRLPKEEQETTADGKLKQFDWRYRKEDK